MKHFVLAFIFLSKSMGLGKVPLSEARENATEQSANGFCFAPYSLRGWRKLSEPEQG